jgi:DNA N-6-adenine-methyltransferase (Dam)
MPVKIRNKVHDTWLTPSAWYQAQKARFNFDDFDPCPPDCNTELFDGLKVDWAKRTFANVPYSQRLKEAFLWKAFEESKKNDLIVILCPVSTSTKIFHELIWPTAKVEFIRGRLPFEGIDNDGNWCNPGIGGDSEIVKAWRESVGCGDRPQVHRSGQQDLMLVIWEKVHEYTCFN